MLVNEKSAGGGIESTSSALMPSMPPDNDAQRKLLLLQCLWEVEAVALAACRHLDQGQPAVLPDTVDPMVYSVLQRVRALAQCALRVADDDLEPADWLRTAAFGPVPTRGVAQ